MMSHGNGSRVLFMSKCICNCRSGHLIVGGSNWFSRADALASVCVFFSKLHLRVREAEKKWFTL